jgi:hypothetical protein
MNRGFCLVAEAKSNLLLCALSKVTAVPSGLFDADGAELIYPDHALLGKPGCTTGRTLIELFSAALVLSLAE